VDETPSTDSTDPVAEWIDRARTAISNGEYERATLAAYAASRSFFQARGDDVSTLTHREFVTAVETTLAPEEQSVLSTIADAYERVMYTGSVDADDTEAAVTAAVSLSQSQSNDQE